MQEWRVYQKKADFTAIASKFLIDPVTARIIRNRDIEGDDAVNKYLNGNSTDMYAPEDMMGMIEASEIMKQCIRDKRKIRIIGDYDIDGICSIYILFQGLILSGADVDYDVPDRETDGYGISKRLIDEANHNGRDVIITCDNGIAAVEQIQYAKSLGMTVIVTDHHETGYTDDENGRHYIVPNADAVVDPKQPGCTYPDKNLCGAGVAYKLIQLMLDEVPKELLAFAAIATVGDIVDLQDENRIIVKEGLKILRKTENKGLNALMKLCKIDKTEIDTYHIGYIIGPCLNASGRLESAKMALSMLLETDEDAAVRYAGDLKSLNDERKKLTEEATKQAIDIMENGTMNKNRVIVLYLPKCHESIVGIVAGRIKELYYKPVIVLTDSDDYVKGSARSIEEYNIFEHLNECRDLLIKFGGHKMAAGMSLNKENVDILRERLNSNCNLTDKDLTEKVYIDVPMPIDYITPELIYGMEVLKPFGKANPKPVFAEKNLRIQKIFKLGKEGKFAKLVICNERNNTIEAVCFRNTDGLFSAYESGNTISCTYYPEINNFYGNNKLQISITGYRIENIK